MKMDGLGRSAWPAHPWQLIGHPSLPRWRVGPALGAVVALGALNALWCVLNALASAASPPLPGTAAAWALKVALGWLPAALLLARVVQVGPQALRAGARAVLTLAAGVLLGCIALEWLLGHGAVVLGSLSEAPDPAWLAVQRLPLVATALVALAWVLRGAGPPTDETAATPAEAAPQAIQDTPAALPLHIAVPTRSGLRQVPLDAVECLLARGNYIEVHTAEGAVGLVRETLEGAASRLAEHGLVRVHRSWVISRRAIVARKAGGVLVLQSGRQVRVGRAWRDQLDRE